jgi:hypothetical protein
MSSFNTLPIAPRGSPLPNHRRRELPGTIGVRSSASTRPTPPAPAPQRGRAPF